MCWHFHVILFGQFCLLTILALLASGICSVLVLGRSPVLWQPVAWHVLDVQLWALNPLAVTVFTSDDG